MPHIPSVFRDIKHIPENASENFFWCSTAEYNVYNIYSSRTGISLKKKKPQEGTGEGEKYVLIGDHAGCVTVNGRSAP